MVQMALYEARRQRPKSTLQQGHLPQPSDGQPKDAATLVTITQELQAAGRR
jgi:hypothetical protein